MFSHKFRPNRERTTDALKNEHFLYQRRNQNAPPVKHFNKIARFSPLQVLFIRNCEIFTALVSVKILEDCDWHFALEKRMPRARFLVFPCFRKWAQARLLGMPNFDYEELTDSIREPEVLPTEKAG